MCVPSCPSGDLLVMMIGEKKDLVEQAFELFARGELKESLSRLEEAITQAKKEGNQSEQARLMGKMGVILLEADQLEGARLCLEEVLSLSRELKNKELEADALSNLGLVTTASGDPGTGLLKQQEATIIAREINNQSLIMTHIGLLGHAYIQLANMEEAGKAYIEALKIAREIEDVSAQRGFLNNLGIIFGNLDQHENAVRAFSELSELAAESEDYKLALNAEKNLVKHAIAMGEIEQIVCHSRRGLELIDAHLQGTGERDAFEGMLLLGLMSSSQYQEAVGELTRIIQAAVENGNQQKALKAIGQLADAHYALDDLEAAEMEYNKALEISVKLQEKSVEARILGRLAALSADKDDLKKSNQYLKQGLKIAEELNEPEIIGELSYLLALNYQDQGKIDRAMVNAHRSIEAYLAAGVEIPGEKARSLLESL